VIKVDRKREFKNGKNKGKEPEIETSYYLSSKFLTATQTSEFIRGHWSIENSLHYVLDVSYNEDRSRIRKANATENMNILRKITTNMIRTMKGKKSFKYHRKELLLNDNAVLKVIN
jgi:predicted transposase YbfD/YdcC